MKKVILIFVTIVLSGLLYAKDNKSTDALLREIDGIIKNRQTYGAEKEARIADLKKLLAEATSDEQRYGFCGRLFDEYRAYNLDSSFVYARSKISSVKVNCNSPWMPCGLLNNPILYTSSFFIISG